MCGDGFGDGGLADAKAVSTSMPEATGSMGGRMLAAACGRREQTNGRTLLLLGDALFGSSLTLSPVRLRPRALPTGRAGLRRA